MLEYSHYSGESDALIPIFSILCGSGIIIVATIPCRITVAVLFVMERY